MASATAQPLWQWRSMDQLTRGFRKVEPQPLYADSVVPGNTRRHAWTLDSRVTSTSDLSPCSIRHGLRWFTGAVGATLDSPTAPQSSAPRESSRTADIVNF
ncbi:hypothetical protein ACRE_048680 [Hapsidospora chrysogenum ATCC 11550]|uniref:Uncharacterized protein n=1 Tax=Hapsidospora chrysogenum (strain ATCC 11550 / CBS 779.69 / DSM 880 / IAM 14645 / JCM 23072 / IMI 49137) TaxID=857340 RepID=A0A086T4S7_HAPC1|nr:hypothetical protein ACRE_048680 [Hapsidospora chrysogenum ATCC 11550]